MLAPFGSWESPLTTDVIVEDSVSFFDIKVGSDGVYWNEVRPKEKGRFALIRYSDTEEELLPDTSVRTRVHEYGGGAFCLANGSVIYSNDADAQLYQLNKEGMTRQLTKAPKWRFADGDDRIWVCEKHQDKVENCLVYVKDDEIITIAQGHDFYASPRISPNGKQLAFITWDFPNMPWDESTLWLADLQEDKSLANIRKIKGGHDESICQVQWSPEGVLHFASDETGFWNLYRLNGDQIENLYPMKAEFGQPAWVFGRDSYAFLEGGHLVCIYAIKGVDHLGILDPARHSLTELNLPFTALHTVMARQGKIYFYGAAPTLPPSIVCLDLKTNKYTIIKESFKTPLTQDWISVPEIIEYPAQGDKVGYAFYYPPKNPNFKAPKGEKPPLIVKVHGGPTARSFQQLSLETQYWTSRGFAFIDVNYGGSSGFGREYFKRLEKNWGIVDVEDCISAAKTLAARGLVDPNRMVIRGGSAGGYTTLAALAFHDAFVAGTSYYGVSDLVLLYEETHKFESTYNDLLIGPYPEEKEKIEARSPILHVDRIKRPILLLQGTEDKIVLPNQTTLIYEALKKKGIPVGMLLFEGEGHGFRQAPNIKRALDAELYFYSQVLDIPLPHPPAEPPVEICNKHL